MRDILKSRIYGYLVTIWVALSVGGIALALMVWLRLGQSLEASLNTARVELGLVDVLTSMRTAENDERSFILTGDRAYRDGFERTAAEFPGKFAWLSAASPSRQQEVGMLRSTVTGQLMALRRAMEPSGQSADGEIPLPAINREQTDLDQLQAIIARIVPLPQQFLAFEATAARRQLQRSLFITLAAGLLSLGTGVFAFYLARVANEKEQNERLLAQQALRAERVASEKSLFMANMSHEIRTPMNAILGFSETLAAALPANSRQRRQAQAIQESAASLLQLINDILDLSKEEVGRLEIHRELTDLRELSDFIRMVFSEQVARKGLSLEITVAPDLPAGVLVDRTRLRQVLVNLLANALKFTSKGGVTLRTLWKFSPDGPSGQLVFEVEDTGIGIPRHQQEAVFQPFVQVETPGIINNQGSGLGLSIVRRLTERMDGTVAVESEVGRGSLFRATFPNVTFSQVSAARPAAGNPEDVDFNLLRPATILAVDDNALNRELLASMFEQTHHTIRFAANGREAVESVRISLPNLVLMDLRMPEMDGTTALAEIRRLPHGEALPVIAVTASGGPNSEPAVRAAFTGYVRKPFTRRAIFAELARFLPRLASAPAPTALPEAGAGPKIAADWSGLLQELNRLQENRWPDVRQTGSIADVKDFAHQLSELAQAQDCPRLQAYADELRNAADDYAIIRIEKHLDQFSALITALAQPSASAPSPVRA